MRNPIAVGIIIILLTIGVIASLTSYLHHKSRGMWDQKGGNFQKIFPFPIAQSLVKYLTKEEWYLFVLQEQ